MKRESLFLVILTLVLILSLPERVLSQEKIITINPKGEKVQVAKRGIRKGFFAGYGIGFGGSWVNISIPISSSSDAVTKTLCPGLATDLKVGYAPSNNLALYLTVKNNLFLINREFSDQGMSVSVVSPIMQSRFGGLLGMSYFLKPESPSLFFSLGLGSFLIQPFLSEESGTIGFAGNVGWGFEFIKHILVEMDCFFGTGSFVFDPITAYKNPLSIILTASYVLY